jgi:hypothetical protein
MARGAFADTAAELRNHLSQLKGVDAVDAALEVQVWSRSSFDGNRIEQGQTAFRVRGGENGIEFQYSPSELSRAEMEELNNRSNPELKTPTMTALREIDALEARDLLNFAPTILGYLERGKLLSEKEDTYAGRPARLVTLSVDPPIPQSLKKRLRDVRYVVKIWIATDGYPVGGEASLHGKARFLVVSFEHNQTERWAFARRGDRLIVLRHNEQMNGSGLGNKFERRLTVHVRPQ